MENKKKEYLSTQEVGFLLNIAPIKARYKAETGELKGMKTENGWSFPISDWEHHPRYGVLLEEMEKRRENSKKVARLMVELIDIQKEDYEEKEQDTETIHTYEIEQTIPVQLNPYLKKYFENHDTEDKLLFMTVLFLVMQKEITLEKASFLTSTPLETFKGYLDTYNIQIEHEGNKI